VKRIATTALALALLAAACSSTDEDPASSQVASSTTTDSPGPDGLLACSSLGGTPTVDVDEFFDQGNACGVDTGGPELQPAFLGISDLECADGTYLYWNDVGWGADPGDWVASDRRSPPRDLLAACRGE